MIVGGGVSGLATAYFLSKQGIRCTIIEKSRRLGGLVQTERVNGCVLEGGPDSYLAAKPAVTELANELGELKTQVIGSNDRLRRIFIVRGDKLVPMPRGMSMIAPGEWMPALRSELFSAATKLRFLTETLMTPCRRATDVTVAQFVRDHFGAEVLEYVAEPLLAGVYGGDSAKLSAESVLPRFLGYERKYGSLIRGVQHERQQTPAAQSMFLSFRYGMQSVTEALAERIGASSEILCGEAATIERKGRIWRVRVNDRWLEADQIVLACPAHVGARLLAETAPELASELVAIPYSSAVLVTLVYARKDVPQAFEGFGFLVPRRERRTISAATWIGTKFPFRVPDELAAIRTFIVDQEANALLSAPEESIVELVRDDLERLVGIRSNPIFVRTYRWPNSMPQYTIGHAERQTKMQECLEYLPGIHLTGNAYDGVGIPDCVRLAKETANGIAGLISDSSL